MSEPLRIGIAGLGTVGQCALKILQDNAAMLEARAGRALQVTAVAMRDVKKQRDAKLNGIRIESNTMDLATATDVDVVVELIGGYDGVAKDLVIASLKNGKHVVSANKALVAHHGKSLAELAEKNNVVLAFEAAVAGGIPIIAALRDGLAANRINRVAGILNGTCNYILTTMEKTGRDFGVVLSEAQNFGYAEAEPSIDVDGTDTAHKVAILSALAFGTSPDFSHVHVEGIRRISIADIEAAKAFGYRIKLLGIATRDGKQLLQRVHPCLVPLQSPLGVIDGPFNAVQVEGDAVGRVVFEGRGAGGGPTGSAVVADLIAIARGDAYPPFSVPVEKLFAATPAALDQHQGCYYLRLSLKDEPGVLAEFTRAFAAESISVHSITQQSIAADSSAQVIVLTHETNEAAVSRAADHIAKLNVCVAPPVVLRIEN